MPKRILFLEHNVDGTVGGSHVCLLSICKYLDQGAWTPIVVFYQDNSLIDEFERLGVEVRVLPPFKPWVIGHGSNRLGHPLRRTVQSALNFLRMTLVRPWYWFRVLGEVNADAVHLNNSCGGDVDLVIAAKLRGIPVIAHQRGFPPRFGRVERFVASRMDRIIAVSDAVRDHLIGLGLRETKVLRIHDGIELSRLEQQRAPEELRRELQLDADCLVVGMLGNVKRWKGQEVLVDAIGHLSDQYPDVRYVFVGKIADESYKVMLDKKVKALGAEDRVTFTGYRSDATDLIAIMDVVVHASIEPEPFGLVVLEAMGKGKPIVATDIGGPKETVVDGITGSLFETGSAQGLANKLAKYLSGSTQFSDVGKAGPAHVRARFSAEHNVAGIERVYAQLFVG